MSTQPTTTTTSNPTAPTGDVGRQTQVARVFNPETFGLPSVPVTDPTAASQALAAARAARCHVLGPLTIGSVPPGFAVAFRVVSFAEHDYYEPERGSGKFAHLRHALDALLAASGGSTDPEQCRRVDDRTIPYYWEYQAGVKVPSFDGGPPRRVIKTRILDLRDGAPEAEESMGKADDSPDRRAKKLRDKRKAGPAMCETKAMNRAIRAALGIRQSYGADERYKPFVCPVLVYQPDMTNPVVAEMAAAVHFGVVDQVYGGRTRAPLALPAPPIVDDRTDAPIDVEPEPVPVAAKPAASKARAGIPAHPDDAPTPRRTTHAPEVHDVQATPAEPELVCDECGVPADKAQASRTLDTYDRILCREHEVESQ